MKLQGVNISDVNASHYEENTKKLLSLQYELLVKEIGLDPKKIYIKLCAGGNIRDLTNGKYEIDKEMDRDELAYSQWKKLGIPEKNFIWDKTRDTFLSLFMFIRPTPWGYRNEILYDVGKGKDEGNLLDIGTIEHFKWRPIFEQEGQKVRSYMIKSINPWKHCVSIAAIGMERILMAKNGFDDVVECNHISKLYNKIIEDANSKDSHKAFIVLNCLKTIHRILIDAEGYGNLSEKRKQELIPYFTNLSSNLKELKIPLKKIKEISNLKLINSLRILKNRQFCHQEI